MGMKSKYGFLVLAVATMLAVRAFEVKQVFREERFTRGNVNLRVLQPADEADWIWIDDAGPAADTMDAVRFAMPFEAQGEPLVRHVLANGFNQSVEDPRTKERQVCTIALDQLPAAPFDIEVRALSSLGRKSAPLVGKFKG